VIPRPIFVVSRDLSQRVVWDDRRCVATTAGMTGAAFGRGALMTSYVLIGLAGA